MYSQQQLDSRDPKHRRATPGQMAQRIVPAALQRRVQQLRQQISDDLQVGLSHDVASLLVIDGGARSCWQLAETAQRVMAAHRATRIHRAREARGALECPFADVWLVVVRARPELDPVALCQRLRNKYEHARIIAIVGDSDPFEAAPLACVADWVCDEVDVEATLSGCAIAVAREREYLLPRLVLAELSQRVVDTFGWRAALQVGLKPEVKPVASVGSVRRELLRCALAEADGNRSRAARLLDVSRSTLYRWLEQDDG